MPQFRALTGHPQSVTPYMEEAPVATVIALRGLLSARKPQKRTYASQFR